MNLKEIVSSNRISCPECRECDLIINEKGKIRKLSCGNCKKDFGVEGDIPLLISNNEVFSHQKEEIKIFRETTQKLVFVLQICCKV